MGRTPSTEKFARRVGVAVLLASTALSAPAMAQLTGGAVVAGKATISQPSATSTLITQTSSSAILTWTGFSIPHGSSVTFLQPSSSAIALNRVLGGSPSFLFGTLSANGQVWLINPAGIVVGRGGSISAAGVLLSTADIHNADFLAGNYSFDIPGKPKAGILNRGTITASKGGSVVLAGAHVTNEGLIAAALGSVVVAGASTYAVDFAGDGLLSFAITNGSAASGTLVNNTGTISAQGGLVLLTAQAATSVLDNVINTSGIVEATSAANENGTIVLSAAGGGTNVSGLVDASGKGSGQTGGTVEVLGDSVTLAAGAAIDVSGDAGGGTALIGGNFHGAGPLPNAAITTVAAGSFIDADAITSGNGGRIAVWSNGTTTFDGAITARGGGEGGNGGYVETSGEQLLWANGTVDTSALAGHDGTWLLDPGNLSVCISACTITPASITTGLGTGDVVLEAIGSGNNTEITSAGSSNLGASTGDITVSGIVNYSSANQLTLLATGTIAMNTGASIQNGAGGAVNLVAGWNGTAGFTPAGAFSAALLLASPSNYGASGGNITIGDGSQGAVVAVGTRSGQTTIAADNLTIEGSNGSNGAAAAVGFNGPSTGSILVMLNGNLTLAAGTGDTSGAFAQIGNFSAIGALSGTVTVQVAGTTAFDALALSNGYTIIGNANEFDGSATASGGVMLTTGTITETNNGFFGTVSNDIPGGNLTIETTAAGTTENFGNGGTLDYDSTFGLTLVVPSGTLNLSGTLENDGTGPITLSAAAISLSGTILTGKGAVSVTGPVTLVGDGTIDTTDSGSFPKGANISFNGTIDDATGAAGTKELTITAGTQGDVLFGGAIGGTVPIWSLNLNGAALVTIDGNITTGSNMEGGGQINFVGSPTVLGASVVMNTTTGTGAPGTVFFDSGSPVNSTNGTQSLTINAGTSTVEFDANIGATMPLGAFTATGGEFTTDGVLNTAGGAVTISTAPGSSGNNGDVEIGGNVTTSGGAFTVTATGTQPEIDIDGTLSTGAGNIMVTATGTADAYLYVDSDGSIVTAAGSVTLASNAGTNEAYIDIDGTIATTTGAVSITATGTSSSGYAEIQTNTSITTAGAPVSITGVGPNEVYIDIEGAVTTAGGNFAVTATSTLDDAEIFIEAPVQTGAGTVTLTATGDEYTEIDNDEGSIATTTGAVSIAATSTNDEADVFVESPITTQGAAVTISATNLGNDSYGSIVVESNITTQGGAVTMTAIGTFDGDVEIDSTVSTGAGNVTISSQGGSDEGEVEIDGGITTTTGAVNLSATSTATDAYVDIFGSIQTGSGGVTITASSPNDTEIDLDEGSITTASGAVVLTATSTAEDADVYVDGNVTTLGAPVTMTASAADDAYVEVGNTISTGAGAVMATVKSAAGSGFDAEAAVFGDIATTTGAVTLAATGDYAEVYVDGTITTGGAPVAFTATGALQGFVEADVTISTSGGALSATATATDPSAGAAFAYFDGVIGTGGGNVTMSATSPMTASYGEVDATGVSTSGGTLSMTAQGNSAYLFVAAVNTGSGAITGSATGAGYTEIDIDNVTTVGAPMTFTATGSMTEVSPESLNVTDVFIDGPVATNGGAFSITATGQQTLLEVDEGASVNTGPGNISFTASDAEIDVNGPLLTTSGSITLAAQGPNSVIFESCGCTNALSTTGGALTLFANGSDGELVVDDPLTLTGPTTLVAQQGIFLDGGASGSAPLTIYSDAPVTGTVTATNVSTGSYEAFPGIGGSGATSPSSSSASTTQNNATTGEQQSTTQTTPEPPPTTQTDTTTTAATTLPGASAPPPPATTTAPTTAPTSTAGGSSDQITSPTDIDSGSSLFSQIVPGTGGSEPTDAIAVVAAITPATQPEAQPELVDRPLGGRGSNLFQARNVIAPPEGTPGIHDWASSMGNPSLWFATLVAFR